MANSIKGRVAGQRGDDQSVDDSPEQTAEAAAPLTTERADGGLNVNFVVQGGEKPGQPEAAGTADPVALATLCQERGYPELTAEFITGGVSIEAASSRLDNADAVMKVFADAEKVNPRVDASLAKSLIAMNATAEQAQDVAGKMLVGMQSPQVLSARAESAGEDDCGWGRIIESVAPKRVMEDWKRLA